MHHDQAKKKELRLGLMYGREVNQFRFPFLFGYKAIPASTACLRFAFDSSCFLFDKCNFPCNFGMFEASVSTWKSWCFVGYSTVVLRAPTAKADIAKSFAKREQDFGTHE